MLPTLRKRFDRLEQQRVALLRGLAAVDQAGLEFRPADGGWSSLDVVEHLVLAEELMVGALRKDKAATLSRWARWRADATLRVVFLVFALRRRLRAPTAAILPSGQSPTLAALTARWGEARCQAAGLLEPVDPARSADRVVRHPVAGWLTRPQILEFHRRHINHHARQLARLAQARAYRE